MRQIKYITKNNNSSEIMNFKLTQINPIHIYKIK